MTSPRPKGLSITKFLRVACAILEIIGVLGVLVMLVLVPFAESHVANGSHITISKNPKLGSYSYVIRPSKNRGVTVTNETPGDPGVTSGETGSVSVGPFSVSAGKEGQFFQTAATSRDVSVQKVEGMVTFTGPATATEALRVLKWPAVSGELCTLLIGLACLEMLRRLLSSSEKGDLFTDSNVRLLRQIAFLIIVLDLVRFAAGAVLTNRMNVLMTHFFADGTWMLPSTMPGRLSGVVSGMTFLLLAEVFREGLKFRKDSDLTI
jgi:hypothetical protein